MLTTHLSLLERLRTPGDEAAWVRFVELYTPLMLRWAERRGLQPEDAADLVQDVMALLLRKLADFQYDAAGKFRAWLWTVFQNKHRERSRRKEARTVSDANVFNAVAAPEAERDDSEDQRILVRRGLELIQTEFSKSVWQAFWEYAVRGRPPDEVAAELGLSPGTIYASKSRVLNRLRLEIGFLPE